MIKIARKALTLSTLSLLLTSLALIQSQEKEEGRKLHTEFDRLSHEMNGVSFPSYAREQTRIKYNLADVGAGDSEMRWRVSQWNAENRMYETTTGALAIQETLQMERFFQDPSKDEAPSIDIKTVEGITVKEHPWEKMLEGKKPDFSPIAQFVPQDNYYIHFKTISSFLEFSDLLDEWGTNISSMYEVTSRDMKLKERLERQICIRSGIVGRILGPMVVSEVAVTGSDPYVREGSDFTILFRLKDRPLFQTNLQRFLDEAKKTYPAAEEGTFDCEGVKVDFLKTALREVSHYRADIDDVRIVSNSPAGIRRVIECAKGKRVRLSDALDFRYMRTLFPLSAQEEDGFVFLSDPFIRTLVGPASKIKEKRRMEAMASLRMITNAAMLHAWRSNGKTGSWVDLVAERDLDPARLVTPPDAAYNWDEKRGIASCVTYNTLAFATPLIELPLDKITPSEQGQYRRFRDGYQHYWRRYFDPIGIRIKTGKTTRMETIILPLIDDTAYRDLKRIVGEKKVANLSKNIFSDRTLMRYVMALDPESREVQEANGFLTRSILENKVNALGWLGDWVTIWIEDSSIFTEMAAKLKEGRQGYSFNKLWFRAPITLGVHVKDKLGLAATLMALRSAVNRYAPDTIDFTEINYKEQTIVVARGKDEETPIEICYATIGNAFYLSTSQETLKRLIDLKLEKKLDADMLPPAGVGLALYPGHADNAMGLALKYLLMETRKKSLENNAVVEMLYRTGLVKNDDWGSAALQYLGFVPLCPDGGNYLYDTKTTGVTNTVHGSLKKPNDLDSPPADSPTAKFIRNIGAVDLQLSFTPDGLHSIVTIERK